MAHITGGGLPENLPRCLPEGMTAKVEADAWPRSALFQWLQSAGSIPERDLWHTFNMGIGFCIVVPKEAEQSALEACHSNNHQAWVIGEVLKAPPGEHSALQGLPS